jgi:hypothetical protein
MPPSVIHRLTHPGDFTAATVACSDPRATLATWNVADVTCPECLRPCTCGPGVPLCPACSTWNKVHRSGPTTLPPLKTEKAFQEAVKRFAFDHGWMYYHVYNARNSPAGFPDVTLVRVDPAGAGARLVFAELKMPGKVPTAAQRQWLEALDRVQHVTTYVWHPDDWGQIERVLG